MNSEANAPMTIDDAVSTICASLSNEDKFRIKAGEATIPQVHATLGRWLRKQWKMDHLNSPLANDFRKRFGLVGSGDDVAAAILIGVWAAVKDTDPRYDQFIIDVERHYRSLGVDPRV